MSEEPKQPTVPEFVTKALHGGVVQIGLQTPQGMMPIAHGGLATQVRQLELMVEALSRCLLDGGCPPGTMSEKWLEVCQEKSDELDKEERRIVTTNSVPPVNGHAKRFGGNIQFPKA